MTLLIQLPAEIETRLQNLTNITGYSQHFFISQAILENLDELENTYLLQHELQTLYSEAKMVMSN